MDFRSDVDILGMDISLGEEGFRIANAARNHEKAKLCSAKIGGIEMAVSTCMKCAGHSFEVALVTPIGESRKLTIVQCSQCGTPVAVMDPATGPAMEALKNQIAAIDERLNRIAKALTD